MAEGASGDAPGVDAPPIPVDDPGDEPPTTRPWEPQPVEPAAAVDAAEADPGDHPDLLGTARSGDPRICPFLRLEQDGQLNAPLDVVSDRHLCVAFGDPRPQSERQQELLCLQAAHSNCARYLRGVAQPQAVVTTSRFPRATIAAILLLLASVGFSFGFVLQRGGLELTGFTLPTPSAAASATGSVAASTAVPGASPSDVAVAGASPSDVAVVPGASASPAPTVEPSPTPVPSASASPSPVVSPSATAGPTPSASPGATPLPTPVATPLPTPAASPAITPRPTPRRTATPSPTSDRFAVITKCSGRSDCWIYTIRVGDNLFSIAHWFGVSLDRIYAMNPWAQTRGIHPGNDLLIPTPTR